MNIDIRALTGDDSAVLRSLGPAFARYNEEQFTTAKLPGGSQQVCSEGIDWGPAESQVLVSSHNALGDSRYYDAASQTSFAFDHVAQVCPLDGKRAKLMTTESILAPVACRRV